MIGCQLMKRRQKMASITSDLCPACGRFEIRVFDKADFYPSFC